MGTMTHSDSEVEKMAANAWNDMHAMPGGAKTRKVVMHLAGKKTLNAKMSIYGEVMQGPPEDKEK